MADLNPIYRAASELQTFLEENRWRFCFIGGLAVQRWGEPRLTVDVDATLLTGFGREEEFVDRLLKRFSGRRADSRQFALQTRVALLQSAEGTPLDVALGAMPFEERAVGRASPFDCGGCRLITCSAEDLIVLKCFAGRDRDWADVEGILLRGGARLNLRLVREELAPLAELKEDPGILPRLERKIEQVQRPG